MRVATMMALLAGGAWARRKTERPSGHWTSKSLLLVLVIYHEQSSEAPEPTRRSQAVGQ